MVEVITRQWVKAMESLNERDTAQFRKEICSELVAKYGVSVWIFTSKLYRMKFDTTHLQLWHRLKLSKPLTLTFFT